MMKPDGWLLIRMAASPDDNMRPAQVRIPFSGIRSWAPESFGIRIEFPNKRVIVPWWNVADIEIHFNSPDYVQDTNERGHHVSFDPQAHQNEPYPGQWEN